MGIGPQLPPHLQAKRKLDSEGDGTSSSEDEGPSTGPVPGAASPNETAKRRKIMGPAPPPAPLEERPSGDPEEASDSEGSSDSEDGYGPDLPSAHEQHSARSVSRTGRFDDEFDRGETSKPLQRDEWMSLPPKQDDLAARMDPLRKPARGFNTGKGARGPSSKNTDISTWTETPEQKRKRLEDEVLGIKRADGKSDKVSAQELQRKAEDEEKARKVQEYNDKYRSKSLYEQHQTSERKQKEDDPSKRAFDYEKDVASGTRISHADKRDLLKKASDMGSRFSKGSYL